MPAFEAVARTGDGVLETLSAILDLTLEDLVRRHPALVLPPQQTVSAWTARSLRSIFGRDTLSGIVAEEEAPSSRPLKLRIAMPEEAGRPAGARRGHPLGRVPGRVLRRGLGGAEPRLERHAPGA